VRESISWCPQIQLAKMVLQTTLKTKIPSPEEVSYTSLSAAAFSPAATMSSPLLKRPWDRPGLFELEQREPV
jgi:hypothetical protein